MRVGTRALLFSQGNQSRDHPHACGDKNPLGMIQRFAEGSSPCVWGQAELTLSAESVAGIIPMRVGTS